MTTEPSGARQLPTLEAVAAAAGVSRATVSRVVNGSPKVSPDVLERVNAAIRELDYSPNRAARSLAKRQTHSIALLVPERASMLFGDPFIAAVVQSITERIDATDYVLTLLIASRDPQRKAMRYLFGGNVDGAIVVSHHASDAYLAELAERLPVVFLGRPQLEPEVGTHYVDADNRAGAVAATEHLIALGRHRIGSVTGSEDMTASADRLDGFRATMREHGREPDLVAVGDFTEGGGMRAALDLLDREPELDGLFVASDLMALGAIRALRAAGRRIPEDVAVVGFDDLPLASVGDLKLTTVLQPAERMGWEIADRLLRIIAGEEVEPRRILPTELVVRDSA